MNSELPARSKCVLNDHMNNMAADRHLFEYWISAAKPWGRIHSAVRGWQRRMVWQAVVSDSLLLKRLIDLAVASAALLALSPLFGLVVLVIKLDDRGPIFFCQQRVGLRGRTFAMWKFRSMRCDAEILKACLAQHNEIAGGVMFKMKKDPRITCVGKWLRKFSIDEMPQLWNVLKGDINFRLLGRRRCVRA